MADKPENLDESEGEQGNQTKEEVQTVPEKRKISSKVLLASIIGGVSLLFGIGGFFFYKYLTSAHEQEKKHSQSEEEKNIAPKSNFFIAIPDIVVNLRSTKPKGNILRATFILQLYNKEDEPKVKEFMPIILDQVLSYLRDQSIDDLEGAGLERMRQAMLLRINNIIRPMRIHRVILKDFIIQ